MFVPARFLNWGVPAPECRVLGSCCREFLDEWRWEEEGGLESGGPNGSGRPFTFMALIAPLLLLPLVWLLFKLLFLVADCWYCPREAESYRECRRSGSLVPRTGSLCAGGAATGVRPTGGRLVLDPASYPVKVDSRKPFEGMFWVVDVLAPCSNPRQLLCPTDRLSRELNLLEIGGGWFLLSSCEPERNKAMIIRSYCTGLESDNYWEVLYMVIWNGSTRLY